MIVFGVGETNTIKLKHSFSNNKYIAVATIRSGKSGSVEPLAFNANDSTNNKIIFFTPSSSYVSFNFIALGAW